MIGQLFGNYRAVRKLGEGGMGVVYEAVHEEIGKRAAVKVLQAAYSRDPQLSARFLTEPRARNLRRESAKSRDPGRRREDFFLAFGALQ